VWSTLAEVSDESGGSDAFEAFYRRTWRDAVRWASALTGSVAAGEDVAQEAFARLAGRFESIDNAEGYLRTTIVNLARDNRRATQRRTARELRVVDASGAPGPPESEPQLLRALAALDYEQRAALVLRYWADWDEASIAGALGCRRSTVRSHAKRGLDALRRSIEASPNHTEVER
jgi:RNA polymerase sigma factor (sigma-70 family)